MRDTYKRELRKEKEARRSGAAAGTGQKWRFLGVLSFLEPFITPRPTSGNMAGRAEEEQSPREPDQQNKEEEAADISVAGGQLFSVATVDYFF